MCYYIQSKTDIVQMSFYIAIGVTTPDTSASITPEQFYSDVNTIFEGYNKNDNFLTYLVDGDQHCFTPSSVYYTAGRALGDALLVVGKYVFILISID